MLCLWKLLPQRNRGISLEGHWRVLTHKLYKFWGIYTITKLKIEISLSYHTSLMELVILLKELWTPVITAHTLNIQGDRWISLKNWNTSSIVCIGTLCYNLQIPSSVLRILSKLLRRLLSAGPRYQFSWGISSARNYFS